MSPLGKGLGALIPTSSGPVPQQTIQKITQETLQQTGEQIWQIPIEQIEANSEQPRKNFARLEMEELTNSIREYGIIQPLILTRGLSPNRDCPRYEIVAGERRWRAAQLVELKTVPAIVRTMTEMEKFEISLLENVQRQDLNPMERARAYQRLIEEFGLNQEQIAQKLGKARATIANNLRLLVLPTSVQQAIESGRITEGHAKTLLSIEDTAKQEMFLKRILGLGLTVRETEDLIRGQRPSRSTATNPQLLEQERRLSQGLNSPVKIKQQSKGGKIVIHFTSDEELKNLIDKILNLN
ncbi:MAG: ParB/RepB/Spo0J family partition protein [Candidatus Parcubacteria bacterium]|nr:ParB/RepB/Spo0J family partition protein [Candidatus Parcubacteria bacterium]